MSNATRYRRWPGRAPLLALHAHNPVRYPVLFESSAHALDASARAHARWDYLFLHAGEGLETRADGRTSSLDGAPLKTGFLSAFDEAFQAEMWLRETPDAGAPDFKGGWCVFLGYELTREIEPVVDMPRAAHPEVRACALRTPAAIAYDHVNDETWLLAEAGQDAWLDVLQTDIESATPFQPIPLPAHTLHEQNELHFLEGVDAVLEYLAAGDVFQVNLSRAWDVEFSEAVAPATLHAVLRAANPAPFSAIFSRPDWAVVSASPERLVKVSGSTVEARPIAGTRARVAGDIDAERTQELAGHPKERAEHVMLVDLIRNDIGRVSKGGTVEVNELMVIESFAHVHHIVSNVRGECLQDTRPADVIRAVFPGGTITGCPKVRCMQIIAELEGEGRGAYTGSVGWINRDGDLDLNILIRSAALNAPFNALRFRTGAGIVMDSVPESELAETRAKARGMLKALATG